MSTVPQLTTPRILRKGCVCGHDHVCDCCGTDLLETCPECVCTDYRDRCQNCGEESLSGYGKWDVCSRRCGLQLDYAEGLIKGAIAA